MNEVQLIERPEQAGELLQPVRIELLSRLGEPRTCPELARELGLTTQKVNYHMKVLRDSGFVKLVAERRNRGTMEGIYQAAAKSFWFSPRLVAQLGGRRRSADQASLNYLLSLAEDLQTEVGHLAERDVSENVPTLGIDAQIELRDASDRSEFLGEIKDFFQQLASKYGSRTETGKRPEQTFRLMLACYPQQEENDSKQSHNDQGDHR